MLAFCQLILVYQTDRTLRSTALSVEERTKHAQQIAGDLDAIVPLATTRALASRCRSWWLRGSRLCFVNGVPMPGLNAGLWNILFPADGAAVVPTVVIAPLVDRTLVALDPKPLAIGVGHPVGALATIYPQPHDIPMGWIVTGSASPKPRLVVSQRPS